MLRGEVYWVKLDGIGSEQKGNRPCIVIQNDIGNKFSPTTVIVPMTGRIPRKLLPTHLRLSSKTLGGDMSDSVVLCEQSRIVDKQRVGGYIGQVSEEVMADIDKRLMISLGIGQGVKSKVASGV